MKIIIYPGKHSSITTGREINYLFSEIRKRTMVALPGQMSGIYPRSYFTTQINTVNQLVYKTPFAFSQFRKHQGIDGTAVFVKTILHHIAVTSTFKLQIIGSPNQQPFIIQKFFSLTDKGSFILFTQ